MPPGLMTRSILVTRLRRHAARCKQHARMKLRDGQSCFTSVFPPARVSLRASFDQIAGDRAALVEPLPRGVAHLVGRDGADAVGPGLHAVDGQAGGQRRAIPARQRALAVLRIDRIGDQPVLGALELLGGDALVDQVGDHRVDRALELRQRRAVGRRAVDAEPRRVERGALIPGAGADRDAAFPPPARGRAGCWCRRRGYAPALRAPRLSPGLAVASRRHEIAALQARLLDARIGQRDRRAARRRRLLRAQARLDLAPRSTLP